MARKWSNQNLPGALHFVTGNLVNRKPVFKKPVCCEAFVDVCARLLKEWPCKLIAWVLMPDHFHMIVNPKDGRVKEFLGALKSLSANRLIETAGGFDFRRQQLDASGSRNQVWQESFKAQPLGVAG